MRPPSRRSFLAGATTFGASALATRGRAADRIDLRLNGQPGQRDLTSAFPEKGPMVLQRARPALLETPIEVFDQGVFTPNDRFFVRWHWSVIPEQVDPATFTLAVRGHVDRAQSLSMADILAMPRVELAAVNQCSGNSRGLFQPRVPGAQWANGAMGNARWAGVRLRDVLDKAGVKPGAVAVRFNGLDQPPIDTAPDFIKSLAVDHARDGEVMLAYQMNGEQLPLLNGFPLRLIVPGWFSTYWVKMLSDIEVLEKPDDNYWMKSAYLIPSTPRANVKPGETGFPTEPINRMVPRSFFTNVTDGSTVKPGATVNLRGIAMGGDCGVTAVDLSYDKGATWVAATLGADEGKYGFRRWTAETTASPNGLVAMVRATNSKNEAQPMEPNWNGGGYLRNVVESVHLAAA